MALLNSGTGRVILWFFAAALASASAQAQHAKEPDVKAVFLYKFTNFVEWPSKAWQGSEPFRVCVAANSEMMATIERTLKGEAVNARPVETTAVVSADDARRCHMLFVGRTEMARAPALLAGVRELPVLTVGEAEDFLAKGGAIAFVLDDGRVRFDINVENAKRGGLSLSSRLLQVAHRLEGIPR